MNDERFTRLFNLYYHGTATTQERDEFLMMLHTGNYDDLCHSLIDRYYAQFSPTTKVFTDEQEFRQLRHVFESHPAGLRVSKPRPLFRRWLPYAAAILMILGGTWIFFGDRLHIKPETTGSVAEEIPPGGNRATLILADGRTVDLSTAQSGIVAGDEVKYVDGSLISGLQNAPEGHERSDYNTLTTPRGGTYQIILPDGTKVWLNSASTLRYPSRFTARERTVEISGEAYFSVAKDKDKPFRVFSNGQKIEVLGTQFNLSAYPDDDDMKTTLVEGSVQIENLKSKFMNRLKPGQQAVVRGGSLDIQTVDIEPFVAWKDGYFYFSGELQNILQQVSRWYDIKVEYETDAHTHISLDGRVSRRYTLNNLLKYLGEAAGNVQISVQGTPGERRILVK